MQTTWMEFQRTIKLQLEEQQEKQDHINSNLSKLITGLSTQVLQIATKSSGDSSDNSNFSYSRLSKIDFHDLMGKTFRDGFINANNSLKLRVPTRMLRSS